MSLEPGELVEGKYRIVNLIGEGGMGAVYEGENVRIRRRVAIKVLHAAFTGNTEVTQRFEREAQAAGRIGNDHILEVLDMGSLPNGDHFMVMEFLDGETLSQRIKSLGRVPPLALAPLARQMLEGLAAAHNAGIIHRDLKPDNVFILREKAGKRDFVKIIDFGISKFQPLSGDGMKMTRTGAVMGTPYYMSPEQASGASDADARSDLYSIAVMLYEAVTGRVPFDASTFNQLMFKIVLSDSPPPQSIVPELDPAFCSLIMKGMSRDVARRFQTAQEFIEAIDAWIQTGRGVSVPPAAPGQPLGVDPGRASMPSFSAMTPAPNPVPAQLASQPDGSPVIRTAGNWATSQSDVQIPKKSKGPLIAALAGVLVLVLGGGALAALKLTSKPAAEVVPPAVATQASAVEHPEPAAPPAASSVVEPAKVEPAKVEPSAPEAPASAASAETKPAQPVASATKRVVAPVRNPGRFVPPPARPPTKPAAKAPEKKPASVDFGY